MYKKFLIFLIRYTLVRRYTGKSFNEADKFCNDNPQYSPHIVIITFNKSTVN